MSDPANAVVLPSGAVDDEIDAEIDELLSSTSDLSHQVEAFHRSLEVNNVRFGNGPLPTFLRPHVVERSKLESWVGETESLFALLERAARRVLSERDLLEALGFGPDACELLRIDPGYAQNVVIARPDATTVDGRLRFFEINTDSPAMMTMADEVQEVLLQHQPFSRIGALSPEHRVVTLLRSLLGTYQEYSGGPTAPTIAIIDWPGENTRHELAKTAERFTALGVSSFVAHPAQLQYDGRRLRADGRTIDLVYRRVLFDDFLTRQQELSPLLRAYRDGNVCMANPLRSFVLGTKAFLSLLCDESNPLRLLPAERDLVSRCIPETRPLRSDDKLDRREWVLKKAQSHGGAHVVLGNLADDATWEQTLSTASSSATSWVRQRIAEVGTLRVPVLRSGRVTLERKFMNYNPFVFRGRYGGGIARVSDSQLINICLGGGLLPTLGMGRAPSGVYPSASFRIPTIPRG